MNKPSFLIIGAAKCGTTALWYNLDKHPDIAMASKTDNSIEMHFWGSINRHKGLKWYYNRFESGKLGGEKSVEYCSNKRSLVDVKKHIPDIKLIYCIRNPVDRAYSNFQMHKKSGRAVSFNFNTFKRYAGAGKYIHHIEKTILSIFKKEQLHICVTEYMKNDVTSEMRRVFDFLDVEDLNLPAREIPSILLANKTRQEDILVNKQEDFYRVWSKKYTSELDISIRKKILDYYKPYNEKLFNFLGYEIEEWSK